MCKNFLKKTEATGKPKSAVNSEDLYWSRTDCSFCAECLCYCTNCKFYIGEIFEWMSLKEALVKFNRK